jgi:hypothetical protein
MIDRTLREVERERERRGIRAGMTIKFIVRPVYSDLSDLTVHLSGGKTDRVGPGQKMNWMGTDLG